MDWRDKLKKAIEDIKEEASRRGEADIWIEVAQSTWTALIPFMGHINATDLSGMTRGKILLIGLSEHVEHTDWTNRIYKLCFSVRWDCPFHEAFRAESGETVQIIDALGNHPFTYTDFNAV